MFSDMKRSLEYNQAPTRRTRARATDVGAARAEQRSQQGAAILPHIATSIPPPTSTTRPTPTAIQDPDKHEHPSWERMRQLVLSLPNNVPRCVPYLTDEIASIAPEDCESVIQVLGKWCPAYIL